MDRPPKLLESPTTLPHFFIRPSRAAGPESTPPSYRRMRESGISSGPVSKMSFKLSANELRPETQPIHLSFIDELSLRNRT